MTEVEAGFRRLFAMEARQRLDRMGELLLALEGDVANQETVAALFREAHTLKGAAAMVGETKVRDVAHGMEDALQQIRSGAAVATSAVVDSLLGSVDVIRAMLDGAPTTAVSAAQAQAQAPAPARASTAAGDVVQVSLERLDELVRTAGESAAAHLRLGRLLATRLGTDPRELGEFRELQLVLNQLQELTLRVRMVPVATLGYTLHRALRELARTGSKPVRWEMAGGDTELDRAVLERLADPLLHLVRNAVDHGIEAPAERTAAGKAEEGLIRLHAMQVGSEVVIAISDDGRGIDLQRVRTAAGRRSIDTAGMSDAEVLDLIFKPGFSTAKRVSDVSGRGVGLDVVRSALESIRGRVEVRTEPGRGSEFRLAVPITLAVIPCMLVSCAGQCLAIPIHSVVKVLHAPADAVQHADRRAVVMVDGQPVPISSLAATLALGESVSGPVMVLAGLSRSHAFRVDAIIGQRDILMKGLGELAPRLDVVAGASIEPDGSIIVVLEAARLVDRARGQRLPAVTEPSGGTEPAAGAQASRRGEPEVSVMVVDDALTIRELQKSILERAGYRVRTASNGAEALAMLATEDTTLVLTDIEMPKMDGFALIEAMRKHPRLAHVPVIILSSRGSEADRRRGLEAGADGYIVKSAFDQTGLLSAVNRLLGKAA
jgi:two-component system chemotaxis sensor kinase CheA